MEDKKMLKNEEMIYLSARVPKGLVEAFWETKPKGVINQHVLAAAARLWISLPEDYRKRLIDIESELDVKPDAMQNLVELMRQIAQDEFRKQLDRK